MVLQELLLTLDEDRCFALSLPKNLPFPSECWSHLAAIAYLSVCSTKMISRVWRCTILHLKKREGKKEGWKERQQERRHCLRSPRFSLFRPLLCLYIGVDFSYNLWGEMKARGPPPKQGEIEEHCKKERERSQRFIL